MISRAWATEGQFADDQYEELVFVNSAIETFLNTHEQFLVVASKGMGKTLLMRLKKQRVQADPSIVVIPQNAPVDNINLGRTYPRGILGLMEKQGFWEDMWKLAIQASILLNFPHRITEEQKKDARRQLGRADLPSDLENTLAAAFDGTRFHDKPSTILRNILENPQSKIEALRGRAPQSLYDLTTNYVTSACFVFIDSFDQEIEGILGGKALPWAAAQCGLMRAAWDISRQNRHIKVYATIRQEAYASYGEADISNIRGSVFLLKYTKDDLHSLLEKAIKHYEGYDSVEEFVGLTTIFNGRVRQNEKPFDYMRRHLIDVPRWHTRLGKGLATQLRDRRTADEQSRLQLVREEVNRASADLARDYLYNEMRLFFRGLPPQEVVRSLFSHVRSTVLSLSNVEQVSDMLLKEYGWEDPFSLLYNLGLLGVVRDRVGNQSRYQAFKRPYEFDWGFDGILPRDSKGVYLLHPALLHLMLETNLRCKASGVLVGDGISWSDKNDRIVRGETIKVFVSYAHADEELVKEIVRLMDDHLDKETALFDIWLDSMKMEAGRAIHEQIGEAVKESDFLILVASPHSLKSEFVKLEWERKLFGPFYNKNENRNRVLPIYVDGTGAADAPDFLRPIYGVAYDSRNGSETIRRLVEQLLDTHREAA
jgi:TIR domain